MYLKYVQIVNFKNLKNVRFEFSKGANTIIGENDSGKSNALTAIRILLDDNYYYNTKRLIRAAERAETAYERKMYRYKAQYSLDCENGIENAVLLKPQTPEEVMEDKQLRDQLYAAVMTLPDKQAKRIYARFYLGMTPIEIAKAEKVDVSRVRDSIRRGLKNLSKLFR